VFKCDRLEHRADLAVTCEFRLSLDVLGEVPMVGEPGILESLVIDRFEPRDCGNPCFDYANP
jgi:hypothetical protein